MFLFCGQWYSAKTVWYPLLSLDAFTSIFSVINLFGDNYYGTTAYIMNDD